MDDLKKYCHLTQEHSFIEVTEWWNGEGIDVAFDDKIIQLSWGQLDAINVLAHYKE
jgi:hypothetical protein